MVTIVVTYQPQTTTSGNFRAHIKEDPDYWGVGKSPYEAIGDLVHTHSSKFNINIERGEKPQE